jgi:hypothetical protein
MTAGLEFMRSRSSKIYENLHVVGAGCHTEVSSPFVQEEAGSCF